MKDKQLGAALAEVCEQKLLAKSTSLPADFDFSKCFEDKMRRILGKDQKPCVRKRVKTVFIIAAVLAASSCLAMRTEPDWNFIVKDCTGGKNVSFDVSSVDQTKNSIEQTYEIGAMPQRFSLGFENESPDGITQIWSDKQKASEGICFGQFIPSIYQSVSFSDKAGYCFGDDGTQYYIDENDEGTAVVWFRDGYVFLLSGSLSKNEMLGLCKTLKISEKRSACLIQ